MPLKKSQAAPLTDSAPGGGLDGIDAILVSHKTVNEYEYKKAGTATGATANGLVVEIEYTDEDGQKQMVEQFYSSGKALATEDGTGFQDTPKDTSKAKIYIMALKNLLDEMEGAPTVEADVRVFDGIKAHMGIIALPKMSFETKDERGKTCLVAKKILALAGKTATKPSAAGKGSSNSHGDLDAAAVSLLKDVLGKAPGKQLPFENLAMKVWMAAGKTEHASVRQEIKSLITIDWVKGRKEFETDGEDVGLA